MNSSLITMVLTILFGIAILLIMMTQIRGWIRESLRLLAEFRPHSRRLNHHKNNILSIVSKENSDNPLIELNHTKILNAPKELGDRKLIVIANREPYIHDFKDGEIEITRPASGLVTALEPILRELGGLWIAHGSGSADLSTVDSENQIAVPPSHPKYRLLRVFLSQEEELGYYYGFANEGLWPLCHLAHNRPSFRLADWEHYQAVNQRFALALDKKTLAHQPIILVQDYHFALVPQLLRARSGFNKAKVGLFWHIPWPNPEAFGICPWNQQLLKGMLGSDVIGFHTQYHCNNFLETCNRYLEARIDWEKFSVTMEHHETQVRAFPIGIEALPVRTLSQTEINELKEHYGISAEIIAVGVDRIDYTKGIVERVEAVERLFEKHPEYIGKFSLVQMGSPSRTPILAYRNLTEQLKEAIDRVNQRYSIQGRLKSYKPIIFLNQHYEWDEIQYFYQLGDICLVTSLHDGMNLVAKEYVWCQQPERGSLILSKFTGASRELTEAFIVNPYSIEELADTIAKAISLPTEEKSRRMKLMKEKVKSRTAFHWASDLIRALIEKDQSHAVPSPKSVEHLLTDESAALRKL